MHEVVLNAQEDISTSVSNTSTMVLRLGYNGKNFSGYAAQDGIRTVEGCVKQALETFLQREVTLACAGRTDAGVHAQAQYVSLPIDERESQISRTKIMRALAALCPEDISVRTIYHAPDAFSARFDAQLRSYTYRIAMAPLKPILTADFVWWARHIDHVCMDDMNAGASYLVGEHNFESFCKTSSAELLKTQKLSLRRYIKSMHVSRDYIVGEQIIRLDITGNAFLHNMVRIIVGALLEVGRGARDPQWIKYVLEAQDRTRAATTVPACGLTLEKVAYPPHVLTPWE